MVGLQQSIYSISLLTSEILGLLVAALATLIAATGQWEKAKKKAAAFIVMSHAASSSAQLFASGCWRAR